MGSGSQRSSEAESLARAGEKGGKRPFLTYSILSGWGMLHITPLTQTSPSQEQLFPLPMDRSLPPP